MGRWPCPTPSPRPSPLTLALQPRHATRLVETQEAGVDEDDLREIAAEALGEDYFRDDGRPAHGLEVEFKDIVDLQIEL
ncbi:hypothetical protein [Streptomyces sp. NRRL S-1022]|uniref:hypothetical protein n=1 Tax=Streptomyces sp. NRRL S-1022 TaxID=1463880 RepID=UPI000AD3F11D|nr:hypothetical protein [Streptomyces sp. NRRL S-1022]